MLRPLHHPLRRLLRRFLIKQGVYEPCCASCGERPTAPAHCLCSSVSCPSPASSASPAFPAFPAPFSTLSTLSTGTPNISTMENSGAQAAALKNVCQCLSHPSARSGAVPRLSFSARLRNAFIRALPLFNGCSSCLEKPPAWRERRAFLPEPAFPIDFVYTWVDGADPALAARRASCLTEKEQQQAGQDSGHYQDSGELLYSLRSLEKYAPWVRHIWLVTDKQTPDWLDIEKPGKNSIKKFNISSRITIVDHTDFIPAKYLPTFSVRTIEAHLHLIPGLAEHYVYCNDDFFLLCPCEPKDFFTASGLPYIFMDWRQSRRAGYAKANTAHAGSWINARAYLEKQWGFAPDIITAHAPYPHSVKNSTDAYAFYEPYIRDFAMEKIRSMRSMSMTGHGIPLWAYAQKRAVPFDLPFYYMRGNRADRAVYYAAMLRDKDRNALPPFLCVNDTGSGHDDDKWRADMLNFLEAFYTS